MRCYGKNGKIKIKMTWRVPNTHFKYNIRIMKYDVEKHTYNCQNVPVQGLKKLEQRIQCSFFPTK